MPTSLAPELAGSCLALALAIAAFALLFFTAALFRPCSSDQTFPDTSKRERFLSDAESLLNRRTSEQRVSDEHVRTGDEPENARESYRMDQPKGLPPR
jgi:hypothetical protein